MGVVKDVADLLRDLAKFAARRWKHGRAKDRLDQAYREALKPRPNIAKIKSVVHALENTALAEHPKYWRLVDILPRLAPTRRRARRVAKVTKRRTKRAKRTAARVGRVVKHAARDTRKATKRTTRARKKKR